MYYASGNYEAFAAPASPRESNPNLPISLEPGLYHAGRSGDGQPF